MESLSGREGYARQHKHIARRVHGQDRRVPRLPTPESSKGSHDTLDSDSQEDGMAIDTPVHDCNIHHLHNYTVRAAPQLPDVGSNLLDSRNPGPPNSPPYQISDAPRPSLPPLKIVSVSIPAIGTSVKSRLLTVPFFQVLGDRISSPPQTPNVHVVPLQPSPCEPIYTSTTYKPPSLYPNKKQRTDLTFEPIPIKNHFK